MKFSHITPIPLLEHTKGRDFYLTLAHLVEQSPEYNKFHLRQKDNNPDCVIILDNSGFEMYKQGREYLSPDQLIELGRKTNADYLVMTDYPAEDRSKTEEAAEYIAPKIKEAGFGTFFCPQSKIRDIEGLIKSFIWAATNPNIDYIGLSILAIPNAYGVETNNKLQRYLARTDFCNILSKIYIDGITYWEYCREAGKRIHALGMVDGPNEIALIQGTDAVIDSWDSSAAIWAGIHGISFDTSPTGLTDGKFEKEVNFFDSPPMNDQAKRNMKYIDFLVQQYNKRKLNEIQ